MLGIDAYGEWFAPHVPYKVHKRLPVDSKQFLHALHSTTLASRHHDSRFEVLTNAVEFYPAMLDAITHAEQSVNMECCIFRPDGTGHQFMDAMMERARAGVIVTLVEEVTMETWERRPLIEKIVEPFAWILERQQ